MDVHFHIETPDERMEPTIFPSDRLVGQLLENFVGDAKMKIHPPNPDLWQFEDANTGDALDPTRSLQHNGVSSGHLLKLRKRVAAAPPAPPPLTVGKSSTGGPVLVRCENGHYYDPKKHTKCPHCPAGFNLGSAAAGAASDQPGSGHTQPARNYPHPDKNKPSGGDSVTQRLGVTNDPGGIDPVVGWLIAVNGPDKGRDFRIRSENNSIGRSKEMDIYIASDEAISRERHAVVTFDAQRNDFYLSAGDVRGSVYLNGEILLTPRKLTPYDRILLGKTALLFIPFCGDKFKWE